MFFPATLDGHIDELALHGMYSCGYFLFDLFLSCIIEFALNYMSAALPAVDTKWVCQVWVRQGRYDGIPTIRLQHPI